MAKSKCLKLLLLLAIVSILQVVIAFNLSRNSDRLTTLQHDEHPNYQRIKISYPENRPTQFNTVLSQAKTNSRGGLVLPANNQLQASNFQVQNHPMKYQAANNIVAIDATTELSLQQNNQQALRMGKSSIRSDANAEARSNFLSGNMEMALRQVSMDENVFQPSLSMGPLEPNHDWYSLSSPSQTTSSSTAAPQQREQQHYLVNNHAANEYQSSYYPTNETNYVHDANNHTAYGKNQQTNDLISETILQQPVNSTTEINNLIYEGPATPPLPSDYYFSSSENLPNKERASNAWWALGSGHEYERASNLTRDDYLEYCSISEFLTSNKQRSLCRSHPRIVPIVARGLKLAIDECQTRFTSNRWNCSLVLQDSLNTEPSKVQVFGEVMKSPNRERSYLNAIVAAGLAHAMTKACSQGELPEECGCDKKIRSKNNRGKIEWVACSDDIDFGARFSRDFTDNTDNESDTATMINIHNYEVGRRVFKSATDIVCMSCQSSEQVNCLTKKCWRQLGPFTDIGDDLLRRYESATHVQPSNKDPHKLQPVRRGVRKPRRKDLVYIDKSPDYCVADTRLGVLGTQNRICNATSLGPDSCSLLCCGRGHQVVMEDIVEDCNCKFVWCCEVKCEKCNRRIINDVCN